MKLLKINSTAAKRSSPLLSCGKINYSGELSGEHYQSPEGQNGNKDFQDHC
jgi:hypothetical protein